MTDPTATPTLKPAAQNPWYLLATLYGEPMGWGDKELLAKNRVAWNRYYASQWTDEERDALRGRVDAAEWVPFDEAALGDFRRQFQDRAKDVQAEMPSASETANFLDSRFSQAVYFFGYVFVNASFDRATFSGLADFSSATFFRCTDFSGATFSVVADFRGSTFSKEADFSRATFSRAAHFGGTSSPGPPISAAPHSPSLPILAAPLFTMPQSSPTAN